MSISYVILSQLNAMSCGWLSNLQEYYHTALSLSNSVDSVL